MSHGKALSLRWGGAPSGWWGLGSVSGSGGSGSITGGGNVGCEPGADGVGNGGKISMFERPANRNRWNKWEELMDMHSSRYNKT